MSIYVYTLVQRINKRKVAAKALAPLKQVVGKPCFSETKISLTVMGGDQEAESHRAKKQLRRKNKLSGLPPYSAHIDGLSALVHA